MTANRKKAPEYLKDDHLSVGTKEYLKVLNSGDHEDFQVDAEVLRSH